MSLPERANEGFSGSATGSSSFLNFPLLSSSLGSVLILAGTSFLRSCSIVCSFFIKGLFSPLRSSLCDLDLGDLDLGLLSLSRERDLDLEPILMSVSPTFVLLFLCHFCLRTKRCKVKVWVWTYSLLNCLFLAVFAKLMLLIDWSILKHFYVSLNLQISR